VRPPGAAPSGCGAIGYLPGEVETDLSTMFPPETLARLREVKAAYDPDHAIRGNHAVRAS
jgi:hypothetical protein